MSDVKCKCEICGAIVIVENFAGLDDDEVCIGIACEDCMDKFQYEENYSDEDGDEE